MEQNKDFETLINFLGGIATAAVAAFSVKQLKDNPDVIKSIFSMFGLNNRIDTKDNK